MDELILSSLKKTWFIDLDGTILIHNDNVNEKDDQIILKSIEFLKLIENDYIIFTTSRKKIHKKKTEQFLKENNIKYNIVIYNLPFGERILINDNKLSGLTTAYALSLNRNDGIDLNLHIDKNK